MNPAYESDHDDDLYENGKRKDSSPAIQSTVLPWKRSSYNSDESISSNDKTFGNSMNKPVKQQEFPPHWTLESAPGDKSKASSGLYENE